jgi:hypothetical protein
MPKQTSRGGKRENKELLSLLYGVRKSKAHELIGLDPHGFADGSRHLRKLRPTPAPAIEIKKERNSNDDDDNEDDDNEDDDDYEDCSWSDADDVKDSFESDPENSFGSDSSPIVVIRRIKQEDLEDGESGALSGGDPSSDAPRPWAADEEAALQEALVLYPAAGLKKFTFPGKKMLGRNEAIASHIFKSTGKVRSGRQVRKRIEARSLHKDRRPGETRRSGPEIESSPISFMSPEAKAVARSGEVKVEFFRGRIDLPDDVLEAMVEGMNKYNYHNTRPNARLDPSALKEVVDVETAVAQRIFPKPTEICVAHLIQYHVFEKTGRIIEDMKSVVFHSRIRKILAEYEIGIFTRKGANSKGFGLCESPRESITCKSEPAEEGGCSSARSRFVPRSSHCLEEIWSPDVVAALREAERLYPPRGGFKVKVPGFEKKLGRCEQIAHHIFIKTGKVRSNKQVRCYMQ